MVHCQAPDFFNPFYLLRAIANMPAKNTTLYKVERYLLILLGFFCPVTADTEVHTYAQIIFSEISEFHSYIQVRVWIL